MITVETEAQKGETILKTPSHDFGGHEVSDSQPEKPGGTCSNLPETQDMNRGLVRVPLFTIAMTFLVLGTLRANIFQEPLQTRHNLPC